MVAALKKMNKTSSLLRNKAIFLDKDGTLIKDVPYNVNPDLVELLPGVAEGLSLLKQAGFDLIVISNQAGVAKGRFKLSSLKKIEKKLQQLLKTNFTAFYYCPHDPEGTVAKFAQECKCRKPEPGLLLAAASDHMINLANSWMIGDILADVEAGKRAGCKTILVSGSSEFENTSEAVKVPELVAADLMEAAAFILMKDKYAKT